MRSYNALVLVVLAGSNVRSACAQQADSAAQDTTPAAGVSAGESEAEPPRRRMVNWNEYEGPLFTIRVGAGLLLDYATYAQDETGKEQISVEPGFKLRDSRLIISGRIKTKRRLTYQAGLMYDGYTEEWFVRQTGLMLAIPEAWGHLWVGRSQEGPSLNRVMTGYDGLTHERFTFSDAAIPLLADGIKWLGYVPKAHVLWNLGAYTNWLSEGESFSYYEHQVLGRVAYLQMDSPTEGTLWHVGAGLHVGKPEHDTLQLKSKPEAFTAKNFVDTGKFPAKLGTIAGLEAYYR